MMKALIFSSLALVSTALVSTPAFAENFNDTAAIISTVVQDSEVSLRMMEQPITSIKVRGEQVRISNEYCTKTVRVAKTSVDGKGAYKVASITGESCSGD